MGDPVDGATDARTRQPSLADAILPLLSVAYGITGFRIERTDLAEEAA